MRVIVNGMFGLGDNLYQLGFVRTLAPQVDALTVCTPWPELYQDVPSVTFHRPHTNLRTQAKNAKRAPREVWDGGTRFDRTISPHYKGGENIVTDMQKNFGVVPEWGLKQFANPFSDLDKPYIIVRPVTARREWLNTARNPLPEYIDQVCQWLSKDYYIISIADLQDKEEWLVGEQPYADEHLHAGELTMTELFGLCQGAAGIVGGVGWIVPFAVNTNVPTFIVCGGNGMYNHPDRLVNDTVDVSNITFATPDNHCMCKNNTHNCDKTISNLKDFFNEWQSIL